MKGCWEDMAKKEKYSGREEEEHNKCRGRRR